MLQWMKIVVAEIGERKEQIWGGGGLMTAANVSQGDAFNDFMCCILIRWAMEIIFYAAILLPKSMIINGFAVI
jgi:hypothetical protein